MGERELHLLRDGAVVVRDGQLILPSHWLDLAAEPDRGQGLLAQFQREVAAGHALEGKSLELLARCTICEDIAFQVHDDGYAVVHLTWRSSLERVPEFLGQSCTAIVQHCSPTSLNGTPGG